MKKLLILLVSFVVFQSLSAQTRMVTAMNCDCKLFTNAPFTWDGNCLNGFCNGYGTIQWYGIKNKKEDKMIGNIKYGKFEGNCILYNSSGEIVYEGNYKNNERNGYGVLYADHGVCIKGNWNGGILNGYGDVFYPNGNVLFKGQFKNSSKHGQGILYDMLGNIIYNGNITGYDEMGFYRPQYTILEGSQEKGKCVDIITIENENHWDKQSKGQIGDYYIGSFEDNSHSRENGFFYGFGSYHYLNGDIQEGNWSNGVPDGKGKIKDKNGNIKLEATWDYGKLIKINYENNPITNNTTTKSVNESTSSLNSNSSDQSLSSTTRMITANNCDCKFNTNAPFTWDGTCKDGYCDGYGTIITYYENGWKKEIIEGNVILGKSDGFCKVYNGSRKIKYEGYFKNGKQNGKGTYYYIDGCKYIGDFKDDECTGYGTFFLKNGNVYYWGDFKRGLANGNGNVIYENGDEFSGEFIDNQIYKGVLRFSGGSKYVGYFSDGKYNGYGTIYDKYGNIAFQGNFKNGEIEKKDVQENVSSSSSNTVVGVLVAGAALYGLYKLFTSNNSSSNSSSTSNSSSSSSSYSSGSSSSSSYSSSTSNCYRCNGTGRCTFCGGKGSIICSNCDGNGWKYKFMSDEKKTCSECDGKGWYRCKNCDHDSNGICNTCHGKGKF